MTTPTPAVISVTTPTSNRIWRTNAGAPQEVLLDFGREIRRTNALGRPFDAATWLDDLHATNPGEVTETGGRPFPPRHLQGTGLSYLYDIHAPNPDHAQLHMWGPNVDQPNPEHPDMGDFDPFTTPRTDARWTYFTDQTTSTGHPTALRAQIDLHNEETLARHLRPYLLDALRAEPATDLTDRTRELLAALIEFSDPRAPRALPPGYDDAIGSQAELMSAALRRFRSPHSAEGTGREEDQAILALIPDEAPLTPTLIADIEHITGRPLRGAAKAAGGHDTPTAASARVALSRWAALWS